MIGLICSNHYHCHFPFPPAVYLTSFSLRVEKSRSRSREGITIFLKTNWHHIFILGMLMYLGLCLYMEILQSITMMGEIIEIFNILVLAKSCCLVGHHLPSFYDLISCFTLMWMNVEKFVCFWQVSVVGGVLYGLKSTQVLIGKCPIKLFLQTLKS